MAIVRLIGLSLFCTALVSCNFLGGANRVFRSQAKEQSKSDLLADLRGSLKRGVDSTQHESAAMTAPAPGCQSPLIACTTVAAPMPPLGNVAQPIELEAGGSFNIRFFNGAGVANKVGLLFVRPRDEASNVNGYVSENPLYSIFDDFDSTLINSNQHSSVTYHSLGLENQTEYSVFVALRQTTGRWVISRLFQINETAMNGGPDPSGGPAPSTVSFVSPAQTISEAGGEVTIGFEIDQPTELPGGLTVAYSVSGSADSSDHNLLDGMVHFPSDGVTTSAAIQVAILQDSQVEPDETLRVSLVPSSEIILGTPSAHVVTIVDDDEAPAPDPSIITMAGDYEINEGQSSAFFVAEITGGTYPSSEDIILPYTLSGTASNGEDYQLVSDVLMISQGSQQGYIELSIINDTLTESSETIALTLGQPMGGPAVVDPNLNSQTITILDNDLPPGANHFFLDDFTLPIEQNPNINQNTYSGIEWQGGTFIAPTGASVNGSTIANLPVGMVAGFHMNEIVNNGAPEIVSGTNISCGTHCPTTDAALGLQNVYNFHHAGVFKHLNLGNLALSRETLSVAAHVKRIGGGYEFIMSKDQQNGRMISFSITATERLQVQAHTASGQLEVRTAEGVVSNNNWHHVAFTYDSQGMIRLYVDGIPQTLYVEGAAVGESYSTDGMLNQVGTDVLIGRREYNPNVIAGLTGRMDDLAIWNRVLSAAEVQMLSQFNPEPGSRFSSNYVDAGQVFYGLIPTITQTAQGIDLRVLLRDSNGDFIGSCPVTIGQSLSHENCAHLTGGAREFRYDVVFTGETLLDAVAFDLETTPPPVPHPEEMRIVGPGDLTVDQCGFFRARAVYADGSPFPVAEDVTVSLSGSGQFGGNAMFYSDAGCTQPTTSVTIAVGTAEGSFYFKHGAVEIMTLMADGGDPAGAGIGTDQHVVMVQEAPEPGVGATLMPGNGFSSSTSEQMYGSGTNARAIARWDAVPDQDIGSPFNLGVVAFHRDGISRVEMSLDGGAWISIPEMTLNPRTNVVEYFATIDPSLYPAGTPNGHRAEVRFRAIPNNGRSKVRSINFFIYRNGVPTPNRRYVSPTGSNNYTGLNASSPFRTIHKALLSLGEANGGNNAGGGEVILLGGTHQIADGFPDARAHTRWVTIKAAPGADVELRGHPAESQGLGSEVKMVKYQGVRLTTRPLWATNGGNQSLWLDNAHLTLGNRFNGAVLGGSAGHQWFESFWARKYVTDSLFSESRDGSAGANLVRNTDFIGLANDVFGSSQVVINARVDDVATDGCEDAHPDHTVQNCNNALHPDLKHWWGGPNSHSYQHIMYGVHATRVAAQGIFASDSYGSVNEFALVNSIIDSNRVPIHVAFGLVNNWIVPVSDHIVIHNNTFTTTWAWRSDTSLSNISVKANIFANMSNPGVPVNPTGFDWNHYASGAFKPQNPAFPSHMSSGNPGFLNPGQHNFCLAPNSINKSVPGLNPLYPYDLFNMARGAHSSKGACE